MRDDESFSPLEVQPAGDRIVAAAWTMANSPDVDVTHADDLPPYVRGFYAWDKALQLGMLFINHGLKAQPGMEGASLLYLLGEHYTRAAGAKRGLPDPGGLTSEWARQWAQRMTDEVEAADRVLTLTDLTALAERVAGQIVEAVPSVLVPIG